MIVPNEAQGENGVVIMMKKLEWPSLSLMSRYYQRLLDHPGSVVVLALEAPNGPEGPQWKAAWLSAQERSAMRHALIKANVRRRKNNELTTSQPPDL